MPSRISRPLHDELPSADAVYVQNGRMSIEDVWANPPPTERKYRKAADSIQQLLTAGRELLEERGLAPGLGRVSLNDAIERSGIPRSSAYRLFSGGPGPLESYRIALLGDVTSDFLDRAERFEAVERTLFEHKAAIDAEDPVELAAALREIIRVGVEENLLSWATSTEWKAVGSAVLAASSAPGDHEEDLRMLQAGVLRLVRGVLPLYRDMAKLGGLRLRRGASWEEFARVTSAALEGVAMRHVVDAELLAIDRTTGPDGAQQTWNAGALIFESLFVSYFEADPNRVVSADLSTWHR